MRGTLYIVAAPSGAGKSSLVNTVLAKEPGIALSISFTSRAPRPGERHAQHYHFVDKAEFERMIAAGDLQSFAVAYLGLTGRNVTFGIKADDGSWVRKPAQDFRDFGAILRHEHAQLGDKAFDSKGFPSTASAAILGLLDTHAQAIALMDAKLAKDRALSEQRESEARTLAIAAEFDRIEAEIEAGEATEIVAEVIEA